MGETNKQEALKRIGDFIMIASNDFELTIAESVEDWDDVTCDDCKDVRAGKVSKEIKKRIEKNYRMMR